MICEYALDPELVARYHDPKERAFFREAFGSESGRFGSCVPRKVKWQSAVRRPFHKALPSASEDSVDRRRLDALLEKLAERMIERECSHPQCPAWMGPPGTPTFWGDPAARAAPSSPRDG